MSSLESKISSVGEENLFVLDLLWPCLTQTPAQKELELVNSREQVLARNCNWARKHAHARTHVWCTRSSLIFIINIKFSDKINMNYFILILIENLGPAIAVPAGAPATPMKSVTGGQSIIAKFKPYEYFVLRGVAANNELATQQFNYHSDSNCDPCENVFYNL